MEGWLSGKMEGWSPQLGVVPSGRVTAPRGCRPVSVRQRSAARLKTPPQTTWIGTDEVGEGDQTTLSIPLENHWTTLLAAVRVAPDFRASLRYHPPAMTPEKPPAPSIPGGVRLRMAVFAHQYHRRSASRQNPSRSSLTGCRRGLRKAF